MLVTRCACFYVAKEMGQMTLFDKKISVYTLDKKVWQSVLMHSQENLERGAHMNDNHIRWILSWYIFTLLLLSDEVLFYSVPIFAFTPVVCLSPFLILAVGISGIGSVAMAFKQTAPREMWRLIMIAIVLSLLALALCVYWFSYLGAYCQPHELIGSACA